MKQELPIGWFDENDVREYRRLFKLVPENGKILELGCYRGRSLCSVADIIKKKKLGVYVVDCFTGSASEGFFENDYSGEFAENTRKFGLEVDMTKGLTNKAHPTFEKEMFDLIFIDAGHSYKEIKEDVENYLPKIKKNGIIAGHDYIIYPDVKKLVDEKFPDAKIDNNIWSKQL